MQKIIDVKLPLAWLIGCSTAIVFTMGGVWVRIDVLARSIEKQEFVNESQQKEIQAARIELLKNDNGIAMAFNQIAEVKADNSRIELEVKSILNKIESRKYLR